jgi:hypothetical protein
MVITAVPPVRGDWIADGIVILLLLGDPHGQSSQSWVLGARSTERADELVISEQLAAPAIRRSESAILQCVAILVLLTCLAVLPTRAVCPRTPRYRLDLRPEIGG